MIDYSEALERIARALGENYRQSPHILGMPGTSLACKVDPFHYLAIEPGFIKYVSRWSAMLPGRVQTALLKTGNLLSDASREVFAVPLRVFGEGSGKIMTVSASFLDASFIDRALSQYAGQETPLPVSRLKILEENRAAAAPLFTGKTPLNSVAFGRPATR